MKKAIIMMIALVLTTGAYARSAPSDTALPEIRNFTGVDTPLEFSQEVNIITGGLVGLFILIITGLVTFALAQFNTNDLRKSSLLAMFVTTGLSLPVRIAELINDKIFFACLGLLICAIGFAYATRK